MVHIVVKLVSAFRFVIEDLERLITLQVKMFRMVSLWIGLGNGGIPIDVLVLGPPGFCERMLVICSQIFDRAMRLMAYLLIDEPVIL